MIKQYSYTLNGNEFLSKHFQVKEFAPIGNGKLYSDTILIDIEFINKLENIFKKLNATKCIISSGYRTKECDISVGGFGSGQHVNGCASDCVYYDEKGNMIPSKIVCCVAYDLGELNGIAKIDNYYVHLDNRQSGYYHGDEQRGNDNYWTNPYNYFGVSKEDVRKYTKEETNNNYRTLYNMNVRCGAGDNYGIKKVKDLTKDGKKNALYNGANDNAIYKKGTVFTALQIINNEYGKWAKTPSGYVCIKGSDGITYSEKI